MQKPIPSLSWSKLSDILLVYIIVFKHSFLLFKRIKNFNHIWEIVGCSDCVMFWILRTFVWCTKLPWPDAGCQGVLSFAGSKTLQNRQFFTSCGKSLSDWMNGSFWHLPNGRPRVTSGRIRLDLEPASQSSIAKLSFFQLWLLTAVPWILHLSLWGPVPERSLEHKPMAFKHLPKSVWWLRSFP